MVDIAKKIASSEVKHFEPAGDLVLIEVHESTVTPGGLHLPENHAKDGPDKGTVVAVGKGRLLEDGGRYAMECKVGDIVYGIFRGGGMAKMKFGDSEYALVGDQQVTGFYRK